MPSSRFVTSLLMITGVILFLAILASLFFLLYNHAAILGIQTNKASVISSRQSAPSTPTPTPPYAPYLKREPNYVGTVESVLPPHQVTLLRPDQSRVVLDLQPGIPIFVVNETGSEHVTTATVEVLALGDNVSVYTSKRDIVAIFVLKK